jgi:hypothetical protein
MSGSMQLVEKDPWQSISENRSGLSGSISIGLDCCAPKEPLFTR